MTFADFRAGRAAPDLARIVIGRRALDPVAIPGLGARARAVWPVLGDPEGRLDGATDRAGVWRTVALRPTPISSPYVAVADGPGVRRLVAVVRSLGARESVAVAAAGPASPAAGRPRRARLR